MAVPVRSPVIYFVPVLYSLELVMQFVFGIHLLVVSFLTNNEDKIISVWQGVRGVPCIIHTRAEIGILETPSKGWKCWLA